MLIDLTLLAELQKVTQQALALHEQEKAAGGAEDEQKWAVLEEQADGFMKAIDTQLEQKEAQLDALIEEFDRSLESDDGEQLAATLTKMFAFWN